MKIIRPGAIITIMLICLSISLSACKGKDPNRYVNRSLGFSIVLPENWERKENFMGTAIVAISPVDRPADFFRENVNVVVEDVPASMRLDDYVRLNRENMRRLMTDLSEQEKAKCRIGGQEGYRTVYSHRMASLAIKTLAYSTLRNNRAYVISLTAEPDRFDKYRKKFEEIAQSFRFDR